MYLSKLEIQGFKSFANKTLLDFQRGITAIVGPNGSGKSNVADAVRWVLGEQSLKLLRGKKSDDVIFAGSDKKSRLGVAEVSLFLNNEDRVAPVDYSEIVITRRVYRDGEGEYLINHQPARLQDIQLLLAQANFGQRTYSVIGQGMIDSFLISSPQERKHLFDEAAGVRQYQLKKDQAIQKLGQSKENLEQGEAIMVEIEPRLRSLTRQVKRLERREEVEKTLQEKQVQYFGLRWQDIERELTVLRDEHRQAESRRQSVENELAAIQQELEAIEQERSASETFATLQRQYNTILDEKNRALEQQAVVKGQLELAAKQAGAVETAFLERRSHELQRTLNQLAEERSTLAQTVERLQSALTRDQGALDETEQTFTKLETQLKRFQADLADQLSMPEVEQSVGTWLAKYDALVEELRGETPNLAMLRDRAQRLQAELTTIHQRLATHSSESDPAAMAALQEQLLQTAQERQARLSAVMKVQAVLQLAEQQDAQLAEQERKLKQEQSSLNQEVSVQELAKTNPDAAYAAMVDQAKRMDRQLAEIDTRLKAAREDINAFNARETTKKERLFMLQKEFRSTQHHLNAGTNQVTDLQVKLARVEQRHDDLKREITQAMSETALEQITAAAQGSLQGDPLIMAEEIATLQRQIQLIGGIDDTVTQEYQETNERWEFLSKQAEDLHAGITSLESAIADLDEVITKKFDTAFRKINDEFNTYFRTLFRGGRAELVLVKEVLRTADEDDMTEAEAAELAAETPAAPRVASKDEEKVITGIEIKATPPGKKLQSIAMLSGGERALTSIALLCAIISNNPSPFVALDEVDAALDEANSQRFAAILEQLAHKTQFITITHNRATMEKASILYGVTMGDDGVSQLLSVKMDQVEDIIRNYGNR
ncbi:MAG: AAA family ATPase [Candidatus Kerfeldbacteria bacterium]|nr:AAA family ATPase [Candidatus Kerfeldbacteria bacterium]